MFKEATLKVINPRKSKQKNPPVWLFPMSIEREYQRVLFSLTRELKRLIKELLFPALPQMIQEMNYNTPDPIKTDGAIENLNGILIQIDRLIKPKVQETKAKSDLIALQINSYNKRQFEKIQKSVLGIDIFAREPWLLDQMKLFSSQNAELIESIPEEELFQISGIVERGFQQGSRFETVAEDLIKRFGITRRRARLIARDQTTKLNSSLTKLRQQEAGVTHYKWITAGDERVRPTHRANADKIFAWDDPPEKTGHPGSDVNCRCVASPILDGVI